MFTTHNTQPTQRTCAAELGETPADGRNFPQLLPRQYPPNTTTAQYTHYVSQESTTTKYTHYIQESTLTKYTHKLTTTARYILTSYPGTTKYIYCCPICPPSLPVYRCSRIIPRSWYVKAEHLISSANDPIC